MYVARLLRFVAAQTEESPHVEFCLLWIKALIDKHGSWLTANRSKVDVELRVVARAVARMRDEIRRLADENVYMVDYLLGQADSGESTTEGNLLESEAESTKLLMAAYQEVTLDDFMKDVEEVDKEWIGLE